MTTATRRVRPLPTVTGTTTTATTPVRRRTTYDHENNLEIPIVSSSSSALLREKLIQAEEPTGLHQKILRNRRLWGCGSHTGTSSLGTHLFQLLQQYVPILVWIKEVTRTTLWHDVLAGITVGVMLIPQSMSYATLAQLQPGYGLYAGVLPPFMYALLGTSKQLAVGPVAMVSLLTASALPPLLTERMCPAMYVPAYDPSAGIPQECGDAYFQLAILLSLLVGLLQLGAGLLRAGFLISFVSHPVVSGFTSGSAITIGLSQVKNLVGYTIPRGELATTLYYLFKNITQFQYVPFLLGTGCTAALLGIKYGSASYPQNTLLKLLKPTGALLVCLFGIGVMYAVPALTNTYKIDVVGHVDVKIQDIYSGAALDFQHVTTKLLTSAVTIAIIGFMESISIAKALAVQHGYQKELRPSQELVALGAANLVGSCFSAYPTTGSFSRSAVNTSTGAQTLVSGMITALVMVLAIAVLAPALSNLPYFCLAAIILSSVVSLFAYKDAIQMYHIKKSDFVLWLVAFLITLFCGAEYGLGISIGLSLLIVIYESVTPQILILWSIPNNNSKNQNPNNSNENATDGYYSPTSSSSGVYRHVRQPEPGNFVRGVVIFRIATSNMYFANSNTISERLEHLVSEFMEEEAATTTTTRNSAVESSSTANNDTQSSTTNNDTQSSEDDADDTVSSETTSTATESFASTSATINTSNEDDNTIHSIVIDMTPVMTVDTTGLQALEEIYKTWDSRKVRVCFVNCSTRVLRTMEFADFQTTVMSKEWFFSDVQSAVQYCIQEHYISDTIHEERRSMYNPSTSSRVIGFGGGGNNDDTDKHTDACDTVINLEGGHCHFCTQPRTMIERQHRRRGGGGSFSSYGPMLVIDSESDNATMEQYDTTPTTADPSSPRRSTFTARTA